MITLNNLWFETYERWPIEDGMYWCQVMTRHTPWNEKKGKWKQDFKLVYFSRADVGDGGNWHDGGERETRVIRWCDMSTPPLLPKDQTGKYTK